MTYLSQVRSAVPATQNIAQRREKTFQTPKRHMGIWINNAKFNTGPFNELICVYYIYEILYYIISYIISYHIYIFFFLNRILYIIYFMLYILYYKIYVLCYVLYFILYIWWIYDCNFASNFWWIYLQVHRIWWLFIANLGFTYSPIVLQL